MLPKERRLPDPPRNVITSVDAKFVLGFIVIAAVFIFSVPVRMALPVLDLVGRLQHGAPATAIVINKSRHGNDTEPQKLLVEFHANGELVNEEISVSPREYETTSIGAKTFVTYLPSNPAVCKIGAATPATTLRDLHYVLREFLTPVGVVYFSIFGCAPLLMVFTIRKQKRELRVGYEAMGNIVKIGKPYKSKVTVTYQFNAEGTLWSGTDYVSFGRNRQFAVGQEILVVYRPGNPKDNRTIHSFDYVTLRDGKIPR